ncbi:MAG TPA: nicotinate-nucleotide--dimethylbenzimidazole phosphoribosyltransferase [Bryobacteraceae bacterium]|nr:nicotinate-nucleotide--dimethylbenzimidazole phosphoribosyltransferase [Bryobacteraceae bacterium]
MSDSLLDATLNRIRPVDPAWIERARQRQLQLTKPPGSLGRLEEIANRIVGIQATLAPSVARARIVVFAADHGACAEGVNPYPQAVTAQMVANYLRGGAAINALAATAGAELLIVDAGVATPIPDAPGLIRRCIGPGTRNFCLEPAMTREQATEALSLGIELAHQAAAEQCALLGIGEMGIGNTTSASAIASALTRAAPSAVVGRGAGADDACLARKRSAVERALALHLPGIHEPFDVLARLGGFEIGAMCGFCLGAAANRSTVLVDGFIATAAAALAVRLSPPSRDYLIAAHLSAEPGHAALLEIVGGPPLLSFDMRLGEGTGAALAIPLVRAAVAAFTQMATFSSAGVSEASSRASGEAH